MARPKLDVLMVGGKASGTEVPRVRWGHSWAYIGNMHDLIIEAANNSFKAAYTGVYWTIVDRAPVTDRKVVL